MSLSDPFAFLKVFLVAGVYAVISKVCMLVHLISKQISEDKCYADKKLSRRWQGISTFRQNYFYNDTANENRFDKYLLQGPSNKKYKKGACKAGIWQGSIRNLVKGIWSHAGQLITLTLAAQVITVQASEPSVTQQDSTSGANVRIAIRNETSTSSIKLDLKILLALTPVDYRSSTSMTKSGQNTVYLENKDCTNQAKISTLPLGTNTNFELNLNVEIPSQSMLPIDKSVPSFAQCPECIVTNDMLTELKNTIHDKLSGVSVSIENNCDYNARNTDNCDEFLKLIKCGVDRLKNGFVNATQNAVSLELYAKMNSVYDDLRIQSQIISDKVTEQDSQKCRQQHDRLKADVQELHGSLNSTITELLKENIKRICIADIGHGNVEAAISKFKELKEYNNEILLRDIVDTSYTKYGELNNFHNILKFIKLLPWRSQIVVSYEALYGKMEKDTPNVLIFSLELQKTLEKIYIYSVTQELISRLKDLNNKLKILVNNIIDGWAYEIRSDNYQEIAEFFNENTSDDIINSNLDRLIERAYVNDLGNAENIITLTKHFHYIPTIIVVLSSLFKQMKRNNHLDSHELIMLTYGIKEITEMSNYSNIPQTYKNDLLTLKDNIPDAITRLIWYRDHCTIKNRRWSEYLYAAADDLAYDSQRRRVFTWRPGNDFSESGWKITPKNNGKYFSLKIKNWSEYLYAAADDLSYDSERRRVFTWRPGNDFPESSWRIKPTRNCTYFSIKSKNWNEYLYAAADDLSYDGERRRVFTWRRPSSEFVEGDWEINCYAY